MVKNRSTDAGDVGDMGLIAGLGRFPWKRAWQPTPVFLPGKSHEQRSLYPMATIRGVTKSQIVLSTRTNKGMYNI